MKKAKEAEEKKSMEKAADKLGVSTEGKTKEEVAKEVNTARFEKRHDLLIEHAKQLGIETEGKRRRDYFRNRKDTTWKVEQLIL